MSGGLRQSLSGLHTWGGLVFGWVLMTIFVAGTICVFAGPISEWMSAKPDAAHVAQTPAMTLRAVEVGVAHLGKVAPAARQFQIYTPGNYVGWTDASGVKGEAHLDLDTGEPISEQRRSELEGRETSGGYFFVGLHYSLHAGMAGILIVGFVTVAMMVALVSGIIIHKRIFKDFFTLRLAKGQRSWLDGHNVASVITLPFQLMIAYTGLCIFLTVWMPASTYFHYGMPSGLEGELNGNSKFFEAREAEATVKRAPAGKPSLDTVGRFANEAAQRSGLGVSEVIYTDEQRLLFVMAGPEEALLSASEGVAYEATGKPLRLEERRYALGPSDSLQLVMSAMHEARFGGMLIRWLWFALGMAGCVMIATGLILFTVKRKQRSGNEFGVATLYIYRLIEALNVASIAGICLASIGYFWANRLISANYPDRAAAEVQCVFLIWGATLLHALLRPGRAAWFEQLGATALLCLALPLLNAATVGDWVGSYAMRGEWAAFGVEAATLLLGIALLAIALRVARRPS